MSKFIALEFRKQFLKLNVWSEVKWSEVKWSAQYRVGGGDESLWKRFIAVVSDEKWETGVKAWVN